MNKEYESKYLASTLRAQLNFNLTSLMNRLQYWYELSPAERESQVREEDVSAMRYVMFLIKG